MTQVATRAQALPDLRPENGEPSRSHPRQRRRTPRKVIVSIATHLLLLGVTAIVIYPVLWLFGASFEPGNEIFGDPSVIPVAPSLDNYVDVLAGIGSVPLWRFAANSVLLAVASVVGVILSSTLSAYAFARIDFPGVKVLFAIMIATLLVPVHVVIIPQYIVFQQAGLLDTYIPLLIGRYLAVEAFFVFLFVQFIRSIPRELDEAARLDGCSHWGIYWRILLPLLRPAVVTASIFTFIGSWNDFFGPLLFLTSPENYTLPLALRLYTDATSAANYGAVMALSMLALIPVLIFFVIFQRFLIDGVATQGLKG